MRKIILGAPSLSGKDANTLVESVFLGAIFPLKLVVKNLVAHGLVFPEIMGLQLEPEYLDGSVMAVDFVSYDALQRLASSVEQIAELNSYEAMVIISDVELPESIDDADDDNEGTDDESDDEEENADSGEESIDSVDDESKAETTEPESADKTDESIENADANDSVKVEIATESVEVVQVNEQIINPIIKPTTKANKFTKNRTGAR